MVPCSHCGRQLEASNRHCHNCNWFKCLCGAVTDIHTKAHTHMNHGVSGCTISNNGKHYCAVHSHTITKIPYGYLCYIRRPGNA